MYYSQAENWQIYSSHSENGAAQKLQKIDIFFTKCAYFLGFERFWPENWDIYMSPARAQKLTFFSENLSKPPILSENEPFYGTYTLALLGLRP